MPRARRSPAARPRSRTSRSTAPRPVIEPPKVDPKKPRRQEPPRQEAAQADPGARQPRGRQGARPRRRHRPPDEDRARQGRRRAAAGRRQLHRGRQDDRASSSATSRSRSASGSASIAAGTSGPLFARSGARDERQPRLRNRCCAPTARSRRRCTTSFPTTRSRSRRPRRSSSRARGSTSTLTYDGSSRAGGIAAVRRRRPPADRTSSSTTCSAASCTTAGRRTGTAASRRCAFGRRGDETPRRRDASTSCASSIASCRALEVQALAGDRPIRSAQSCARRRQRDPPRSRPHCASTTCCASLRRRRRRVARSTAVRGEENDLLTSLAEVMAMRELRRAAADVHPRAGRLRRADRARSSPARRRRSARSRRACPANRLGLARWLTSPGHPLTSRVIVNRYWAQLFGRGLVATPADFGSQGRLPTHPALLDWLATHFVASGWNLKALQKQLVLSATYRQSSIADAAARERDPGQRVAVARPGVSAVGRAGARRRARRRRPARRERSAGRASTRISRPGLWEALATRNATTYEVGKGDDLYRRSLYTVWKRSSPPPSAISFDAAERLFCTVSRQRTSTPLQALVLLNDPQFVEAARGLAARMIREGGRRRRRPDRARLPRCSPAASRRPRSAPRWSRCIATSWRASAGSAAPRRRCSPSARRSRRPGSTRRSWPPPPSWHPR